MSKSLFVVRWLLVLCLFVGGAIACAQEQDEPGTPAGGPNDQDPQRGRGQRGVDRMLGMVPLLRVETVREEIGIDEEQSKTLETVTLQVREDFGAQIGEFLASLRDLSPEERRARRQEGDGRLSEIRAKVNERLQGVLDESQFRRLKEIEVQRLVRTTGVGALTSEDVAAALDLTENQKQQLRDQAADSRGQGEALSLDDVRAQVKEVLTPEQLGKLDTLFGAAFDLPGELLERGRGRFGGRRGGRDGGRFGERRERPAPESEEPASGEPSPE
jgi:hypothetical protein